MCVYSFTQSSVKLIASTAVIDRTATFVARSANPPQFEDKIREGQRNDPKFSFLNPIDPYHAYYRHKLDKVASGETEDDAAAKPEAAGKSDAPKEPQDLGVEPPTPDFILDLPTISPVDLYAPLLQLAPSSAHVLP